MCFWTNTWNHKINIETFWIIREIKKLEFFPHLGKADILHLMPRGRPCHWCHRLIALRTMLNKSKRRKKVAVSAKTKPFGCSLPPTMFVWEFFWLNISCGIVKGDLNSLYKKLFNLCWAQQLRMIVTLSKRCPRAARLPGTAHCWSELLGFKNNYSHLNQCIKIWLYLFELLTMVTIECPKNTTDYCW